MIENKRIRYAYKLGMVYRTRTMPGRIFDAVLYKLRLWHPFVWILFIIALLWRIPQAIILTIVDVFDEGTQEIQDTIWHKGWHSKKEGKNGSET